MTAPRVDIVMPVRNGLPHLPRAVDSIRGQTYRDWRLLVVDDGSTDGGPEWVRSLGDTRITILTADGSGITDALNTGLANCAAPFVARMDADDISEPPRLEVQLGVLLTTGAVAVGSAYEVIDDAGGHIAVQVVPTQPSEIARALAVTNPFCHGSLMFRLESLRSVGGYRRQFPLAEDYDLMLRMSGVGELRNVGTVLYRWRLSPSSSSLRRPKAQALGSVRARQSARRAGLIPRARPRDVLAEAAAPWLARLERRRPTDVSVSDRLWRAGLLRGEGRDAEAIALYDEVISERPFALATRLRRYRAARRSL